MKKQSKYQSCIVCQDCLYDTNIVCKRDANVTCLECGSPFCGGHILNHLTIVHSVTTSLEYCMLADDSQTKGEKS